MKVYRIKAGKNSFANGLFGNQIIRPKAVMGKDFPKDMKTKRKRIETISETTTLLLLKNLNNSTRQSWCGQCQADVFWISPTEINLFGIYELPLAAVHRIGNLICSHSLFKEFVKGKK